MKNYLFLFIIPWSLYTSETKSTQSSEEIIIAVIQQIENEAEKEKWGKWTEISLDDDNTLTTENKKTTPIKKSRKWWEWKRNSKQ